MNLIFVNRGMFKRYSEIERQHYDTSWGKTGIRCLGLGRPNYSTPGGRPSMCQPNGQSRDGASQSINLLSVKGR
jgi:hypothetical protein